MGKTGADHGLYNPHNNIMVGAETTKFNSKHKYIVPKSDRGLVPFDALDEEKRKRKLKLSAYQGQHVGPGHYNSNSDVV